ncbi:MAG: DoxX family protein [Solirubrobacterales bacterium]|nr:DoxX family protein [Solirubrobacterales bacterium]MBV9717002.1 DoxX family protein [Solirubrobacterales bacterium]
MKLGLTLVRAVVGVLFFGHGAQKLFGWFGGHGPEGTAQMFESLGLRPGHKHARMAGAAEAGGGTLLTLGLLTPAAAASLIGVMSTAIQRVHIKNGPWAAQGGYEYNVTLIAILVALADLGPGDLSLDSALGLEVSGPLVALLALAAGIGGAAAMTRADQNQPAGGAPIPGDPASTAASAEPASTVTSADPTSSAASPGPASSTA